MTRMTLKQLAELSGFSIRTVNRVLKNQGSVSEEKRERILSLAAQYHYVPNMAARNLRLNRRNFVGILFSGIEVEVFAQKIGDLEERLSSAGYYPILGAPGSNSEKMTEILRDWSGMADYIIVMTHTADLPSFPENQPLQFIFVDCPPLPGCHSIRIDRTSGVRDAVHYLFSKGRRKILHCGNLANRKEGVIRAFEEIPQDTDAEMLFLQLQGEFKSGYDHGARIMATGADAVIFDTDRMAAGFLKFAAQHGIDVPKRIAVIGFDDNTFTKMSFPSLSTVAQPIEEINSCIMDIIEKNPEERISATFRTRFIPRESVD